MPTSAARATSFRVGGEQAAGAAGNVKIQAYIPAEWNGYEVLVGGKPATAAESQKDGNIYLTFDVASGTGWTIVAEKGKAAEFQKVNRF